MTLYGPSVELHGKITPYRFTNTLTKTLEYTVYR